MKTLMKIYSPVCMTAFSMTTGDEPRSMDEAMKGPDGSEWTKARDYEISQLEKLRTWDLVEPPPNANIIKSATYYEQSKMQLEKSRPTELD